MTKQELIREIRNERRFSKYLKKQIERSDNQVQELTDDKERLMRQSLILTESLRVTTSAFSDYLIRES